MFSRISTFASLIAGASAIVVVLGCQTMTASSTPRLVDIDETDYAFNAPATLQPGDLTIRMVNHGQERHQGQLFRLKDGVTADQFVSAVETQGPPALALATAEGGPSILEPNATEDVSLNLQPGNYLLGCFVSGADGVPHIMKGMSRAIQVAGSGTTSTPPTTAGTFTLQDFSFDMPDTLAAGLATYRVVNAGPQTHELALLKLQPGTSASDVVAALDTPSAEPPFTSVGGMQALSPGGAGFVTLDLQPGSYAAICLVPDPASGVPHIHLGMVKLFTVA
jgi:hypothetical protein